MQHLTGKDLKNLFNNKAVAIVGKAGYGKTFLAKTLAHSCGKKPLFIKHYEGIKNFDESKHNSIVFDDANLRDLKSEQDILNLLDIAVKGAKSDLRHLYGCKRIPNDTQLILTVNDLKQLFGELTRQINRRLNIFELDQKIQLNVNVDNSIKIIFNQHNHIYNNEEDMERNRRI
jgi:ABC-type dipeptide/oligopeptide/nickel transport system ATPase component